MSSVHAGVSECADMQSGSNTFRIMFSGLILAVIANLPFYKWVFGSSWQWVDGFPLGWIGVGLTYMCVFFHEIGHTVFAWFYGYMTIPVFDFQNGGGLALSFEGQKLFIIFFGYALIGYWVVVFKEYRILQIFLVILLGVNLATAFNDVHQAVINFMGHGMVSMIAGFFLMRVLFNLCPGGALERYLNAFFGFGMILQSYIDASGLLKNDSYRLSYFRQKGSHGFGDFDKIDDQFLSFSFQDIIWFWILWNSVFLTLPFVLYFMWGRNRI